MFCFQCEQTAGCKACEGMLGVCGKKADTAELQDKLTGALIGFARGTEGNEHVVSDSTAAVIVEGLFATLTNVNFDNDAPLAIMGRVDFAAWRPRCRLGSTDGWAPSHGSADWMCHCVLDHG